MTQARRAALAPIETASAAAILFVFALLAIAQPLAAYSVALAAFGLPHILSELRYVDRRFGRRLDRGQLTTILALLALVVAIRLATVLHALPIWLGVPAELTGVAALALICARGSTARKGIALTLAAVLGLAALAAPFDAALLLALLHNLTPLGLLWQLAPPPIRARMMAWASAALLALPILVATGLPRLALGATGAADPIGAGPLADHLYVYVPSQLAGTAAIDMFTGAVVAQGGHYLAVILILPILLGRLDPSARGLVPWPTAGQFAILLALAGTFSLALFSIGFAEARSFYGVAAALHAWLEIPILILALTGAQNASSKPTSSDTELASSEISIA